VETRARHRSRLVYWFGSLCFSLFVSSDCPKRCSLPCYAECPLTVGAWQTLWCSRMEVETETRQEGSSRTSTQTENKRGALTSHLYYLMHTTGGGELFNVGRVLVLKNSLTRVRKYCAPKGRLSRLCTRAQTQVMNTVPNSPQSLRTGVVTSTLHAPPNSWYLGPLLARRQTTPSCVFARASTPRSG
jgi:hypothetical protein